MSLWLQYLIAFVVACHGLTYVIFGRMVPGGLKEWTGKEWMGSFWLLSGAPSGDRLNMLVSALHVAAGITTIACAVAIGFAPSLPGWWRPLAIIGAALGIASFAVFFDGRTQFVVEEGVIGAGVSLVLLISAITFAGAFK